MQTPVFLTLKHVFFTPLCHTVLNKCMLNGEWISQSWIQGTSVLPARLSDCRINGGHLTMDVEQHECSVKRTTLGSNLNCQHLDT